MPGARRCTATCWHASTPSGARSAIRRSERAASARRAMASKDRHVSATPATEWLRERGVPFSEHVYDYVDRGGTTESARQLGVDEHMVVKTLVMRDERAEPLVVLMH